MVYGQALDTVLNYVRVAETLEVVSDHPSTEEKVITKTNTGSSFILGTTTKVWSREGYESSDVTLGVE